MEEFEESLVGVATAEEDMDPGAVPAADPWALVAPNNT